MSVFNINNKNHHTSALAFLDPNGSSPIQRYDVLKYRQFEKLTEKIYEPLKQKARGLMASRDMAFRDALHEKLKDYIGAVSSDDFEKFLGDKSKTLEERITENIDVFKRLKDR